MLEVKSNVPSKVYSELLGCSQRRAPLRTVTRCGAVNCEVCAEACLIFKLVSLYESSVLSRRRGLSQIHVPVQV